MPAVTTVIPEPADQLATRERRGSAGGHPVNFDAERYKQRNVVERCFSMSIRAMWVLSIR